MVIVPQFIAFPSKQKRSGKQMNRSNSYHKWILKLDTW